MNKKRFPILIAVAVIAVIVAALLVSRRAPDSEGSLSQGPLLPQLSGKINDIDGIAITQAGDEPLITLQRKDEAWTVAERDGYPADVAKVRAFLLKLADTRVDEAKTSNPERYAQLGVEDVSGADATGVKIALSGLGDAGNAVIVGNTAGLSGGTYVRRVGEDTSLLVGGEITVDREIGQWLSSGIVDIVSSRVREIVLTIGDGKALRVFKENAGDANFKVADIPRNRELQSDVVANGMGSMLTSLSLEDVARDSEDAPGEAELHRASYRLFDGIAIELTGWRAGDDEAWVRLTASLDEAAAQERIAADIAQEQADADAAAVESAKAEGDEAGASDSESTTAGETGPTQASDGEAPAAAAPAIDVEARTTERLAELRREVEQINAATSGWRFRIPSYKFDPINKRIDDMLKPQD